MVKNILKYTDDFDNKVTLEREADGDFHLNVKYGDGVNKKTMITKQDFKKMKYLDAILGENK